MNVVKHVYSPDCDAQWLLGLAQDVQFVMGLWKDQGYYQRRHERLLEHLNGSPKDAFVSKLDKLVTGAPVLVKWFR